MKMSKKRTDRDGTRFVQAKERQEAYDSLSTLDKIALLDRRLGAGKGAKKQRARLAKALAKEQVAS